MTDQPPVLEYGLEPPERRSTLAYVYWLGFRRRLRPNEAFLASWAIVCGVWVFGLIRHLETYETGFRYCFGLQVTSLVISAIAVFWIATLRRWRTLLVCAMVALLSAPAAGIVSYRRCPHAEYFQFFGVSIPFRGTPCSNFQPVVPWWEYLR
jgi:hypothetical protein